MKIFSLRFNREDAAARITSSPLPDQGTLQAKEKWGEFAKFENCHQLACCFPLPWPFCNFTMIICKCGRKKIFWGKTKKCWNVAGCVRHCAADKQTQQQPGQSVLFPLPPFISALTYFPLCIDCAYREAVNWRKIPVLKQELPLNNVFPGHIPIPNVQ